MTSPKVPRRVAIAAQTSPKQLAGMVTGCLQPVIEAQHPLIVALALVGGNPAGTESKCDIKFTASVVLGSKGFFVKIHAITLEPGATQIETPLGEAILPSSPPPKKKGIRSVRNG